LLSSRADRQVMPVIGFDGARFFALAHEIDGFCRFVEGQKSKYISFENIPIACYNQG